MPTTRAVRAAARARAATHVRRQDREQLLQARNGAAAAFEAGDSDARQPRAARQILQCERSPAAQPLKLLTECQTRSQSAQPELQRLHDRKQSSNRPDTRLQPLDDLYGEAEAIG